MKRRYISFLVPLIAFILAFSVSALAAEKITVWHWGSPSPDDTAVTEKCWPVIEKELGVKIKEEFFPGIGGPEYIMKIMNATRFGKGPDMVDLADSFAAQLAQQGFLEPTPEWLNRLLQEKLLSEYRKIHYYWNQEGYKQPFFGTLIGEAGAMAVWWNKEMYAEAGLPGPPKTWKQVFDYGKKLTVYNPDGSIKRSGFFVRTGGHIGGIGDKWTTYFYAAGGESLVTLENGRLKANFNTPAGRKAVKFYLDVLYKYNIDSPGIPGDVLGLSRGETATVSARRPWVPGWFKANAPEMYSKIGVGPIPVPEGKEGTIAFGTAPYGFAVISRIDTEKKELAWKICDRLNQPDLLKVRTSDIGYWLPYKVVIGKGMFEDEVWQNYFKYFGKLEPIPRTECPKFSFVQTTLGDGLRLIFQKEKSIEEGLAAAAKKINEGIKDIVIKEM